MPYLIFLLAALAQMQCNRTQSLILMLCGATQFGVYFYILYKNDTQNLRKTLLFAVFLRFCLVFTMPNLSDDVYRFLWDGTLWHAGLHPLAATPTQILAMPHSPYFTDIFTKLYPHLNSPDYFTVYPSVCQAAFWGATACGRLFAHDADTYIYVSVFALKMLLAFAECGTLVLLVRLLSIFGLSPNKTLIYALNPLVLHEICGNAHPEGFMVFFLAAAFWVLFKPHKENSRSEIFTISSAIRSFKSHRLKDYTQTEGMVSLVFAALLFALSVHAKLLPLLFLPLLLVAKPYRFWKPIRFGIATAFFTFLLALPLFNADFVAHFGESLNLYFQKFEYNASVYYLLRAVGFWLKGYNWIDVVGPVTALLGVFGILGVAWRFFGLLTSGRFKTSPTLEPTLELIKYALFTISIYLSCTTILHPWYLVLPVFLSVFTNFKYAIVWSALIFLTYINYAHTPFYESTWILCLEYGVLWSFAAFEFYEILITSDKYFSEHFYD